MDKEKKIEEYLSSVRHDLRSQLGVVREGTSLVLDGLGKKSCNKCFSILRPALESADKINKLIEELLSTSRFNTMLAPPIPEKEQALRSQESVANVERLGKDDLETPKNELMSMISHAVRTPLTIIKEGISLVMDEVPGKLNAQQRQLIVDVIENVDRLIQSIEKILERPWYETVESVGDNLPNEAEGREVYVRPKNKILLVEDEAAIVDMVKMRLEASNYEVITAGDGQEGLDKARKEKPGLIILDLMLPKMDGYKVCRLLKADARYNRIPVIMFTAKAQEGNMKLVKETGADAYITKPFEAQLLLSKIKILLGKKEEWKIQ